MAANTHSGLTGAELHVPGYCQSTDPGAVGAGKYWIDTSAGTGAWVLKVRKADNLGWEVTPRPQRQFFSGNGGSATLVAGATKYLGVTLDSTESNVYIIFPVAGTIKNLYLIAGSAPGASQSVGATARLTLADTALTCTITGAASNSASDLTHTVSVSAGARFDIKLVATAGMATLSQLTWAVEFDPT